MADTAQPKITPKRGYVSIPFIPFLVGVVVVGSPLVYLKETGQSQWVNRYILLITVMIIFYYQPGFKAFTNYIDSIRR